MRHWHWQPECGTGSQWHCGMRATAKASDGMLTSISGVTVPIRGCRSPLPPGPTSAFQEIGLGLLPAAARAGGRAWHWQPTSVTALLAGGILVGDGRVTAGASELGPAMSDGESGFLSN